MASQQRLTVALVAACALCMASCHAERAPQGPRAADGKIYQTVDSAFVTDVLASGEPSVVYYKAFGCLPCVRLGPHVRKLAASYAGRVTFWELDLGWSAARVRRYAVPAVPTLVFYARRREVARLVGMPSPATDDSLAAFVEAGLQRRSAVR
jgi:thioredoxin-like negative regulator of GroEL